MSSKKALQQTRLQKTNIYNVPSDELKNMYYEIVRNKNLRLSKNVNSAQHSLCCNWWYNLKNILTSKFEILTGGSTESKDNSDSAEACWVKT